MFFAVHPLISSPYNNCPNNEKENYSPNGLRNDFGIGTDEFSELGDIHSDGELIGVLHRKRIGDGEIENNYTYDAVHKTGNEVRKRVGDSVSEKFEIEGNSQRQKLLRNAWFVQNRRHYE